MGGGGGGDDSGNGGGSSEGDGGGGGGCGGGSDSCGDDGGGRGRSCDSCDGGGGGLTLLCPGRNPKLPFSVRVLWLLNIRPFQNAIDLDPLVLFRLKNPLTMLCEKIPNIHDEENAKTLLNLVYLCLSPLSEKEESMLYFSTSGESVFNEESQIETHQRD